jgi:kinetochore protein NDC80
LNLPMSPKSLSPPTQKDFQTIFKHLYSRLDPQYRWERKFEEELPLLVRSLGYPFPDGITKANIMGLGAPHSWPLMLAMLSWLEELVICCTTLEEEMGTGAHLQAAVAAATTPPGGQPPHPDVVQADRMFLDYVRQAYAAYFQGEDTAALDDQFVADFGR